MGFCGGTWEGRPVDGCGANGLDVLAIGHVHLDWGQSGVVGSGFLEEMTGGASVCYGACWEGGDESVNKALVYFRFGCAYTPPFLSGGAGFVGLTAAHGVFTGGIVLVAWGFVLAGGTCVFVANPIAMCPTIVAIVASSSWTSGLLLA